MKLPQLLPEVIITNRQTLPGDPRAAPLRALVWYRPVFPYSISLMQRLPGPLWIGVEVIYDTWEGTRAEAFELK